MVTQVKLSDKKRFILKQAKGLFRKRGFAGISIRDLAKEVKLEPASLYSHFKSKNQILYLICKNQIDGLLDEAMAIAVEPSNADVKLKKLITRHVEAAAKDPAGFNVLFNDFKFLEGDELLDIKNKTNNYQWKFRQVIEAGIVRGVFKEIDFKISAQLIFGLFNVGYTLLAENKTNANQLAEEIQSMVLNGLKK